jgi:hypothetical protein
MLILIGQHALPICHTWTKQSWKCNRISPAPMTGLWDKAFHTASLTISSARGHERL